MTEHPYEIDGGWGGERHDLEVADEADEARAGEGRQIVIEEIRRLTRKHVDNDAAWLRIKELLDAVEGITGEMVSDLTWEHGCTEVEGLTEALTVPTKTAPFPDSLDGTTPA